VFRERPFTHHPEDIERRERKERLAVGDLAGLGLGGHGRRLGGGSLGGRGDRSRCHGDRGLELGHNLRADLLTDRGREARLVRELRRRGLLGRGLQEVASLVDHVLEVEQGSQRRVLSHAAVDVAGGLLDEGLADVLDAAHGVVLGPDVQIAIALVEVEHFARRCEDPVAQGLVEDPAVERGRVGRGHLEAGLH